MKIGIDIRPLMDKYYSGVSEYTVNLLREIFKQDQKNQYKLFYNSWRDLSERIPEFDFPNVEIIKTKYPNKFLNYFLFKFFKYPKIDKKLGGIDLMFMPHFNFITLSNKCKKIITVHDLSFFHYPHFFASRQNFWHKNINIKKLLRRFDQIIAVSENTKKDITSICGIPEKNIKVVHSGISDEYRIINTDDSHLEIVRRKYRLPSKFILYLGNLEPRKNIEGLIEAYTIYRQHEIGDFIVPEAKDIITQNKISLVIAGAQSWKYHGIYDVAKKSAYSEDIYFINYINKEDKPHLYNLAELFAFPSFYEGFGFPPLEAMACGTPIIASNTSSLPEIIDNAGILVNPYDLKEIAEAIKQITANKNLREYLIVKGLEKVKKYNWQKCAQEVIESFEDMV